MRKILKFLVIMLALSFTAVSCTKKPLTLDEKTSMKTLLNASDKDIKDLVIKEVTEKANVAAEDVTIEYILRDKESEAIAVKTKIKTENKN